MSIARNIKNFFAPTAHNHFSPGLFETKATTIASALLVIAFMCATQAPTIVSFIAQNEQIAAVLPGVLSALTNEERLKGNLGALTENELLNQAASNKAHDMASKGYFAHTSPDGKKPWYWIQALAYPYQYAGENLAVNFSKEKDVTLAWMNSPTHKANIIKGVYTEIGTGVATGTYNGVDSIFVAQVYARPVSAGPVTNTGFAGAAQTNGAALSLIIDYVLNNQYAIIGFVLGTLLLVIIVVLGITLMHRSKHKRTTAASNAVVLSGLLALLLVSNSVLAEQHMQTVEYSSVEYTHDETGDHEVPLR